MPTGWPDDPNQRQRPDPRKSRTHNPRNPMDRRDPPPTSGGGGGGSDESGCALWTLMAIGAICALIVAVLT